MSDDLDFNMEVVEDEQLDEMGADSASDSEGRLPTHGVKENETDESNDLSTGKEKDADHEIGSRSNGSSSEHWSALGTPPEDWETQSVGELTEMRNGEATNHIEEGEAKYVVYGSNGPIGSYHEPNFDGGLVVGRVGAVGEVEWVPKAAWVSDNAIQLSVQESVNDLYLYYALDDYEMAALATTTAQPLLNQSTVSRVSIPTPLLPEQRKIASVLYTVDQAIQKTEEIIDQAKWVKRGLMQKLFRDGTEEAKNYQSTQYGPAPSHWSVRQISELATQIQAGGTPDTSKEEYYGGQIPWIRTGELRQKRIRSPEKCITEAGFQNSTARLFSKGTVLVAMYGATAGESAMLEVEATSNQACCGVVTDEKKIYPEFLFQQLLYLKKNLIALGAGSGQQNISKGIISNFRVLVPPSEEQRKIASMLKKWDEKIEVGEQHRNGLKRLKKGIMQDLLTGEVRTADKAIDVLDEVQAHG